MYTIWFTLDCNLQCSYCYENEKSGNSSITYERLDEVFNFILHNQLGKNQNFIVQIHGGEPMMEFDKIKFLIDKLKNTFGDKVYFRMTTNATMLHSSKIDYICSNINELLISIDGIEEAHNLNRFYKSGQGSFKLVFKNTREVLERKKDAIARMTICKNTIHLFSENIIFLANLKFKRICYQLNMNEEWEAGDIDLFYKQIEKVEYIIKDTSLLDNVKIQNFENPLKKTKLNCDGGTKSFTIMPDGRIYPCSMVVESQQYLIGNISDGIDSKKVEELECKSNEVTSSCLDCTHTSICNGNRCKIINEIYTGNAMLAWDYFCVSQNLNHRISKLFS
ncbi:radical SAM/SPASM domain-containing protein [Paenibacillus faecalis]|uniref:radical SAM/SPASM domain-containing protein n=1 Tax=Paenibacillus faecalis TaxID=2079532 RepID=UPI00131A6008|nr:SPASM domain-containing protein [Paenibacillus faecalis]